MANEHENLITAEEKKDLEAELKKLVAVKRPEVIEELRIARSYGDLSENAEYDAARKKQGIIESRIGEIETILKTATVVTEDHGRDVVTIGNTVEVKVQGEGKKVYDIGVEGKGVEVSSHSPIAEALLGKQKGDVVVVTLPKGEVEMTIQKII
ncbi:MAG: transcription elongation factor GreA [Candidatus Kaiserbacteria bacterium]|nr:transcription elongation factor GreA [Candidatus Kaiserbacteria bacterium]